MVMGLLRVTFVLHYMFNDRISAIYMTRYVFGKIVLSPLFRNFVAKNLDNFDATAFEINGHGTSVCYFCIALHV